MKKRKVIRLFCGIVALAAVLCACENGYTIEPKKKDDTPAVSSQPIGPDENTPTPKNSETTPTPKENNNTPTPAGSSETGTLVTAYFQNASYVYQTDSIDFEFSLDNPLFKKKDFKWTLDLKGQTIELDRTLEVINNLTFTNGTIVVNEGTGFTFTDYVDAPLFATTEYGPAKFVVNGGTGCRIVPNHYVSFKDTVIEINGGIGFEVSGGTIYADQHYDDDAEDTSEIRVNSGTGLLIKNNGNESISLGIPLVVEKAGTGMVFETATGDIGGTIINNGGIGMTVSPDSDVRFYGHFLQNSGTGIINKGNFGGTVSEWLFAKSGLLIDNQGFCSEVHAASFPGVVFEDTLIKNEKDAIFEELEMCLFTAKNAIGFDNMGEFRGGMCICGGMPRGGWWGMNFSSYYFSMLQPFEYSCVDDKNFSNTFVNSKVFVNRNEGKYTLGSSEYSRMVIDLNATDGAISNYENTSIGFLNESSSDFIYNTIVVNNYGHGGVGFYAGKNSNILTSGKEDFPWLMCFDYAGTGENEYPVLKDGVILFNEGKMEIVEMPISIKGENGKGVVNAGSIKNYDRGDNVYHAIRLEMFGKNNYGFYNNNDFEGNFSFDIEGEKNTGVVNNSSMRIIGNSCGGTFQGTDITVIYNTMVFISPEISLREWYFNDGSLSSNTTGIFNEGEIITDSISVDVAYTGNSRGISNASSGKISTGKLLIDFGRHENTLSCIGVYNEGEIRADEGVFHLDGTNSTVLSNAGTFTAATVYGSQNDDSPAGCFFSNSSVITITDDITLLLQENSRDSYISNSGSVAYLGTASIGYNYLEDGSEKYYSIYKK